MCRRIACNFSGAGIAQESQNTCTFHVILPVHFEERGVGFASQKKDSATIVSTNDREKENPDRAKKTTRKRSDSKRNGKHQLTEKTNIIGHMTKEKENSRTSPELQSKK